MSITNKATNKLVLYDYQMEVSNIINKKNISSILVCHRTGSGKTITAMNAVINLIKRRNNLNAYFFTTVSSINNFKKELIKLTNNQSIIDNIHIYSHFYTKSEELQQKCKNNIVVIDEFHNFKAQIKYKNCSYNAYKCIQFAYKYILLTATPYVNSYSDFNNIFIFMLYNNLSFQDEKKLISYINRLKVKDYLTLIKYLNQIDISYYYDMNSKRYPVVNKYVVDILLTNEEYKNYTKFVNRIFDDIDIELIYKVGNIQNFSYLPYLNAMSRVASLGLSYYSSKLKYIIKFIKKNQEGKILIYTNWINVINETKKLIKDTYKDIDIFVITGSTVSRDRCDNIQNFNNCKKNCVMIISKAAQEGINLKNVNDIFIIDPHWNIAGEDQLISRAVRINSHSELKKEFRFVNVYKLFINLSSHSNEIGIDYIFQYYIDKKNNENGIVHEILSQY